MDSVIPLVSAALALVPMIQAERQAGAQSAASQLDVPFQKFVLENGLQVILHEDHSDPVVAVYVCYHVGSAREERGRSGFAHLFEHMLFQGSQHVGDDQHFKLVSEAGGNLNGTTNLDRTLYFETLPSNQLELALWLESDRMGFLLPAMTQEKLDNQRDVVKNERRQNYENRPYGRAPEVIAASLFPPEHPYSWTTIGSMADLSAASLEDVHAFFRRWYGPNNATLAIGGDIEPARALELVKKYFGSLPPCPKVESMPARAAVLASDRRTVLEDKVTLPQLTLAWPGVPRYSADDAPLDMLAMVLSQNKSSLLDKALMVDEVLAKDVTARNSASELAGQFLVTVQAAPGISLDDLEARVRELLARLGKEGAPAEQIQRMKNRYETDYVRGFETVSSKTSSLAEYNNFLGDPGYAQRELAAMLAVQAPDVMRVLRQYVLGKPCVILSVVPEGRADMAATGRTPTQLAAESSLDRKEKPASTERPQFHPPGIWHDTWAQGIAVTGTPYVELPLTTLTLCVPGGRRYEGLEQPGASSLTASMMNEGTQSLSTTALVDALDFLGANLQVSSNDDEITLTLTSLNKHMPAALELLGQVLLEPRFDPADFARIKKLRLASIDTRGENIGLIATNVWQRLVFGAQSPMGRPSAGTRPSIEKLTLDDVRKFHREHVVPDGARLVVVSSLEPKELKHLFAPIVARWSPAPSKPIAASAERPPAAPQTTRVFLVDKPGAAQSEIRIGALSVASSDPDFYRLSVLNYILGGAFSSRINMNLREDKGYTYGARTGFAGGVVNGPFTASAGVKTDVTAESVTEFVKELRLILDGVSDTELTFAKNALAQAMATQYESSGARRGFVDNISKYGWPDDYPARRLRELDTLASADLKSLAQTHLREDTALILVVGDKAKVGEKLSALGLGPVVELDLDGNELAGSSAPGSGR
jgi:zinc protease